MRKQLFVCLVILLSLLSADKPVFAFNYQAKISFNTFFNKFSSDSGFQISCITFPIKIIQTDDDNGNTTKYIQKKDWKYTNLLKLKSKKKIIKIVNVNENMVDVKFTIVDTGVLV